MVRYYALLMLVALSLTATAQKVQLFGFQNIGEEEQEKLSPIEEALQKEFSKHSPKETFHLFSIKQDYELPAHIKAPGDAKEGDIVYLDINDAVHRKLLKESHRTLTLTLPLSKDSVVYLDLFKKNPYADDLIIRTDKGEVFEPSNQVHYRGVVRGHKKSVAGLSIVDGEVMGVFATKEHGHINIAKIEGLDNIHAIYPEDVFPQDDSYSCDEAIEVPEKYRMEQIEEQRKSSSSHLNKCVKVYIETNFNLFNNKGSVANVENYVNGIFNNVAILYENEEISSEISEIFVWTSNDPYSSNVGTALTQFRINRQGFNGDIAHLFILNGSGGGVAYLNVLCVPAWAFAVSNINASYNNFPNYSWTIMVVAHEMGHNLGSNHTQWCGWPGGAIDNCFSTEGSCSPGPPPVGGGTIMSYCHLTGWGINFLNGFGPLPGNRIRERVGAVGCLEIGCSSNCLDFDASVTVTNTTCGENNGGLEIAVEGGSDPYQVNIGNGFTSDFIFTDLAAGNYNITVVDNGNCEIIIEAFIEGSTSPVLAIEEQATTCNLPNGSVEATAFDGTPPYNFDFGEGANETGLFTDLASGAYFMTVTDALGCTDEMSFFIDDSDPIFANVNVVPTTCGLDNGSVHFFLSGGSGNDQFFIDIEGGFNFSTETSYENLPSGFYNAYIVDDIGCEIYVDFFIDDSEPAVLSADIMPASCNLSNGSIEASITGIFDWFQLDGEFSSSPLFEGLEESEYELIGQNLDGCSDTIFVFVPATDELFGQVTVDHAYCGEPGNVTVEVNGGGSGLTFDIGNGPQSSPTFGGLSAGEYTVTFTNDQNCIGTIDFTIEGTEEVITNINITNTSCGENNGSFSIHPSGGSGAPYNFSYESLDDGPDAYESLAPGQYVVTISDNSGCETVEIINILGSEAAEASLITESTTCGNSNGTLIVLTQSGISPFTFDVGQGSQSNGEFTNLSSGDYVLTLTDAEGCTAQYDFNIGASTDISVSSEIVNETCLSSNGEINLDIQGGSGEYTIEFNGQVSDNSSWSGLSEGSFSVAISDATGCSYNETFTIQNSGLPAEADFNVIRSGLEITIVNSSSGSDLSYTWSFGDGSTSTEVNPTYSYSSAGSFEICLTVLNSCGEDQLCRNINVAEISACIERDSSALVALYNATDGDNWMEKWNLEAPVSSWYGLSFNSSGCLIRIDLPSNNLVGHLPNEIGDFEQLIGLDLNNNMIGEAIPATIGNLSSLIFLNLSNNLFDDVLPEEFTDLVSARNIELNNNQLEGNIPNNINKLNSLRYLDISHNFFAGEIPNSLFDLVFMEYLDISHNSLEGDVDSRISQLSDLKRLYLNNNTFHGDFPESINQLQDLEALWIQSNAFTSFPDISGLSNWVDGTSAGVRAQNNRLTFKDIVYNAEIFSTLDYGIYAPQARVFRDTTITVNEGDHIELFVDVDVDVDGVMYSWYIANDLKLSFPEPFFEIDEVSNSDDGVYIGKLTHADAPDLTLETYPITIIVDRSTSASIFDLNSIDLQVFPNPVPAMGELRIRLEGSSIEDGKYAILSADGRIVDYTQNITNITSENNQFEFTTNAPPIPGVYFIRITAGNKYNKLTKLIVY